MLRHLQLLAEIFQLYLGITVCHKNHYQITCHKTLINSAYKIGLKLQLCRRTSGQNRPGGQNISNIQLLVLTVPLQIYILPVSIQTVNR